MQEKWKTLFAMAVITMMLYVLIFSATVPRAQADVSHNTGSDGVGPWPFICNYTMCYHGCDSDAELFTESDFYTAIGIQAFYDTSQSSPPRFLNAIWTHECATGGLWLPDYGFPFWLIFSVNDRNPQQYYYDWNTYYSYDEVTPDHWCYVHWFNYSTCNNSPFNPTVSSVEGADWMMFDDPNPGNYVTIFSYTIPWTVVSAS